MRESYSNLTLSPERLSIVKQANRIIAEFAEAGFHRLTVRQIYYRFIGLDWLPESWVDDDYNAEHKLAPGTKNTLKNYKRLGNDLADGRLVGLIDWDAIEDRTRDVETPQQFDDLDDLLATAGLAYRLPRTSDQPNYVMALIEKQTLFGFLEPLGRKWHIPFGTNRGYSSLSAMRELALQIQEDAAGRPAHIVYVGDHDPSGEDMVRDVGERLAMFGAPVEVHKAALTIEQVRQHRLPPNPAKLSDSRAREYVKRHGDQSWELDALHPTVLTGLIETAITDLLDLTLYRRWLANEKRDLTQLKRAVKSLRK